MKSVIAFSVAVLAAVASAAPTGPPPAEDGFVTVQLANDQNGKNGDGLVKLNGGYQPVSQLFQYTGLNDNGDFLATSIQLVANFQNVECVLDPPYSAPVATVNTNKNFEQFVPEQNPLDVTDFSLKCYSVQFN